MKTLVKAQTKLTRVSFNHLNSNPEVQLNNTKPTLSIKFYQNVFLVFFVLSIFLIFPETPKDSENLCKKYNSTEICNVW